MTTIQFVLLAALLFCVRGLRTVGAAQRGAGAVGRRADAQRSQYQPGRLRSDLRSAWRSARCSSIFVITVAAAEVGIGLAIVLMIFRNRKSANIDELDLLKW